MVTGLGAAIQARRGREKILKQVVSGMGKHLQEAPVSDYAGMSVEAVVNAERQRLLDELERAMDEKSKALVARLKQD